MSGNNFKDPEFIRLQEEWRRRLEEAGFEDHEDHKYRLKSYDRRTIAFENREVIQEFFTALEHYLTEHPEMPLVHRTVLELYCEGKRLSAICETSRRGLTTVKAIIRKYKRLIWYLQND